MASETYKYDSVILEQDANIRSYDRSWKIGPHHTSIVANFRTRVAQVTVMETPDFGKVVLLDGEIQSSAADQKFYHQALCRPALAACSGDSPKKVLVLGGGELCTIKEVLEWPGVESVDMVDYDQTFVEFAKRRLKDWHDDSYKDPRVNIHYADAWAWTYSRTNSSGFGALSQIEDLARTYERRSQYDSIIIDLTDLSLDAETAEMIHWTNLIENCIRLLRPNGSISMYVGMYVPWKNDTMLSAYLGIKQILLANDRSEVVQPYKVFVPSFASGEAFFLRIGSAESLQNELPVGPVGEWHFGQKEMMHSISFGSDWVVPDSGPES